MRGDLIAAMLATMGSGGIEVYRPPRTKRRRPYPREDPARYLQAQAGLEKLKVSIKQASDAKQARKAAFRLKQRNTNES